MSDFPVLVKDGQDRTPESMVEFVQLRYDGWAMKDPDAPMPEPKPEGDEPKQNDSTPPTPSAPAQKPADKPDVTKK